MKLNIHKKMKQEMHKKIKQITRCFTPKFSAIKSEDGQLITEKAGIKDRWKRHCKQLMNNDNN